MGSGGGQNERQAARFGQACIAARVANQSVGGRGPVPGLLPGRKAARWNLNRSGRLTEVTEPNPSKSG